MTRSGNTAYTGTLANKTLQNAKYYAATVTLEVYSEAVQLWEGGPYWATMNVGATTETGYGDYYCWGGTTDVSSTTNYDLGWNNTCPYWVSGTTDSNLKFSKYVPTSSIRWGGEGTADNKLQLELSDDAARANWGGTWRMPTQAEFSTLLSNTTNSWETNYKGSGVNGRLFIGKGDFSGKSIFLPAAGGRSGTNLGSLGTGGYYWSSSLDTSDPQYGWGLSIDSNNANTYHGYRYYGRTIRPVHD